MSPYTPADRDLEHMLMAAFFVHGLTIPWQAWEVGAAMDVVVALAMLRVRWIARPAAALSLVLAVLAIVLPRLGRVPAGAPVYALPAAGWLVAFAAARTWSRLLTVASIGVLAVLALARPFAPFALEVWLALMVERVLQRPRPFESFGRLARWRHPQWWAKPFDAIANSRFLGALLEPLPEVTMRSDIRDVIYVNYLVDADAAAALVPPALELQRLGPNGKYALFTFLTYQHGNFGFAFLGPLRRLLPSPVQTNWRIHVFDPRTKHQGIYFLTNAINHSVPALAARLLTEGMPMHVLHRGEVTRDDAGKVTVRLDPGSGSAPDAELRLTPLKDPPVLQGAWAECWPDYRAFLAYCVPQDRAMSSQPLRGRISRQEIDLGIPLDVCAPLTGTVVSRAAQAIAKDAEPLCFHVPAVSFTFAVEAHDSTGQNQ